jgi:hypothetical protein
VPDTWREAIEKLREKHGLRYYTRCNARLEKSLDDSRGRIALKELCEVSWRAGQDLDLGGITYGPAHWEKTGRLDRPPAYYFFLAGFVRAQKIRTVVEVGTWYGGSTMAIARQLAGGRIITIDIELQNEAGLGSEPAITRIRGDAADPLVVKQAAREFSPPLDLLYIDGDHRFEPTRDVIEAYGAALRPKWIILDDVHLGWSMEKLWHAMLRNFGARAYDAGTGMKFRMAGEGQGFGVIDCRDVKSYRLL